MMVVPLVKLVLKEKRDELCCHAGDTQHCVKPLTLWPPASRGWRQRGDQPQAALLPPAAYQDPVKTLLSFTPLKTVSAGILMNEGAQVQYNARPMDKIEKSFHNEFEEAVTSPGQSQRRPRSGDNYLSAAKKNTDESSLLLDSCPVKLKVKHGPRLANYNYFLLFQTGRQ